MNEKARSGLSLAIAMQICGACDRLDLSGYMQLRKLIDAAVNILGADICEEVFEWLIKNNIVGDRLWDVFTGYCDSEYGVFVRMIELVYKEIQKGIDYLVRRWNNPRVMVHHLSQTAKCIPKAQSNDELLEEILRII